MSDSDREPAVACVLTAIPVAERAQHVALAHRLFSTLAQERVELSDGFAIRFPNDAFDAVTRFVANERKCCPFMAFEIGIKRESGPVWLRMTGPEGTRALLRAELAIADGTPG